MQTMTLGEHGSIADHLRGRNFLDPEDAILETVRLDVVRDHAREHDVDQCFAATLVRLGVKHDRSGFAVDHVSSEQRVVNRWHRSTV